MTTLAEQLKELVTEVKEHNRLYRAMRESEKAVYSALLEMVRKEMN